jgi:hypothetical protein
LDLPSREATNLGHSFRNALADEDLPAIMLDAAQWLDQKNRAISGQYL